eukprot:m.49187 g.49187  ORF g.49187 m.49187 type:complete len:103 (+) comp6464_c0_seq1:3-311(+)
MSNVVCTVIVPGSVLPPASTLQQSVAMRIVALGQKVDITVSSRFKTERNLACVAGADLIHFDGRLDGDTGAAARTTFHMLLQERLEKLFVADAAGQWFLRRD